MSKVAEETQHLANEVEHQRNLVHMLEVRLQLTHEQLNESLMRQFVCRECESLRRQLTEATAALRSETCLRETQAKLAHRFRLELVAEIAKREGPPWVSREKK